MMKVDKISERFDVSQSDTGFTPQIAINIASIRNSNNFDLGFRFRFRFLNFWINLELTKHFWSNLDCIFEQSEFDSNQNPQSAHSQKDLGFCSDENKLKE